MTDKLAGARFRAAFGSAGAKMRLEVEGEAQQENQPNAPEKSEAPSTPSLPNPFRDQ